MTSTHHRRRRCALVLLGATLTLSATVATASAVSAWSNDATAPAASALRLSTAGLRTADATPTLPGTIPPPEPTLPPRQHSPINPSATLPPDVTIGPLPPDPVGPTLPGGLPPDPVGPTLPGGLPTTTPGQDASEPATTGPGDADNPPTLPGGIDPTSTGGNVPDIADDTDYMVNITSAMVTCEGMIEVLYDTSATPGPEQASANHLVVLSPAHNPGEFQELESGGHPANGSFTFESAASPGETYRLFVIGMLEPGDPDGPVDVDQAAVLVTDGC